MMIKKYIFLCFVVLAIFLAGRHFNVNSAGASGGSSGYDGSSLQTYKQLDIFGDIFERVRSQYVESPDEEQLVRDAINGMLQSLDPHSSYLDPKERDDIRVQTTGEFGGLGIEVTLEDDLVKVITPLDGTPAHKAGVLAGDLISKIDGLSIRGIGLQKAVDMMRGEVGAPIELTILRQGAEQPIVINIVRAIIELQSVKYRLQGDDVGYLDINSFTEKTYSGLKDAIESIREMAGGDDNIKGYIIDLRLNPGGLLAQAVLVSDAFLQRGEIVSTRGRDENNVSRDVAVAGDLTNGKPLIVLINGGSASASEIVAGALQDHARATILGTRSFGKGSVQTIIPLGQNGALRLTTALYYTPSGCSIQGRGIDPDIRVVQPLPERFKGLIEVRGESELRNSIEGEAQDESGSGSFAYVPPEVGDDIQFNFALDLLRGVKESFAFPPSQGDAIVVDENCRRA